MDIKTLLHGIDLTEIQNHLKEVINLVKSENYSVKLNEGEDSIFILLDIQKNDIIAYRITAGVINIENKNYIEVKRTLGKWGTNELKNLIGQNDSGKILNTIKKILPIVNGFISLIKLKENEKKISIQLILNDSDVIAYQIALAIIDNKLVVNRLLEKYNLNEYLK